jgi:multidrug efflux pump subunit AcrB
VNPVRFSLRYPQVTFTVTALILLMGIQALLGMPRREDPKVEFPGALVMAAYPGATVEQVETQLTRQVEEHLFRYAELRKDNMESVSRPGLMVIKIWTEDGVRNPQQTWAKIQHGMNELAGTSLPDGVLGPILDSEFGDVTAMLLAVQGERYTERELGRFAERIEEQLRGIRAVSKIRRLGEQEEALYVTSSMQRVSRYGISPLEIIGSLQEQNAVVEAGAVEVQGARVPLRTSGAFQAEEEIQRQIVGVSPVSGQPIYIGDFARVERRYRDEQSVVRVDGAPAVLIALEMHEGNNIVSFGEEVERTLAGMRESLPADLSIGLIANQPRIVQERIGSFLRDFQLAILGVIGVTLLLLPFRVAAIAAMAIPVTMAATFALMQTFGIELHQVSLAGLIIVLGMVVDDAIVIADNYVELLAQGIPVEEAAARSALDLSVPVVASTLILVAAFLPLAFLPGGTGDFIASLPITVAIALGCSTVVGMLLTPLLCRALIRQPALPAGSALPAASALPTEPPAPGGPASSPGEGKKPRFNPLQLLQDAYDRSIAVAMEHRRATLAFALVSVVAGGLLMRQVDQQFFPSAERDQFVISLWLPAGTALPVTDRVTRRIETVLSGESEVVSHAAFVGAGPPRFYYNFEPPFPSANIAQILVNTTSVQATGSLVRRLQTELPRLAPEAEVRVFELQQGDAMESPLELRISGPEIAPLKALGARMVEIFEDTPGSRLVRTDYREDAYEVNVSINNELASRLGMSNAGIAQMLAGSFLGAPVSTYWEGTRALPIILQLEGTRRESFDDLGNLYLPSPLTGARVPLREVAALEPTWRPSHIVRRNGIRTLTVGAYTEAGLLPSVLLSRLQPRVEAEPLPPGYQLAWGGEVANQAETFGPMTVALMVSLVIIFLIILLQFRNLIHTLIIMASIPLSLFGAILGLILTGNPFGFTAFLGLISLSGLVVRNAIILLEFIHERMAAGMPLEMAALEAGKRRLRPIFLTSISAAVGVLPMILSGSTMWAPLGSVIAVGVLCSMGFTLIVIPVLYVVGSRDTRRREGAAHWSPGTLGGTAAAGA